jgi:hypothetical protein
MAFPTQPALIQNSISNARSPNPLDADHALAPAPNLNRNPFRPSLGCPKLGLTVLPPSHFQTVVALQQALEY